MTKFEVIHDNELVAVVQLKNDKLDIVYFGEIASSFPVDKLFKMIKTNFGSDEIEINSLTFFEGVKEIAARVFSNKKINKVYNRSSKLTTLGAFCFASCGIQVLDLDWRNEAKKAKIKKDNDKGVKNILIGAFVNNDIDELILPRSVEFVEDQAFANNDIKNTYVDKTLFTSLKGNTFLGNENNTFHSILEKEQEVLLRK